MTIAWNDARVEIPISEPVNKKKRYLEPSLDQEGPFGFLLENKEASYRKRSHSEGSSASSFLLSESLEKCLTDIKKYAVIQEKKKEEEKISGLFSKKLKI